MKLMASICFMCIVLGVFPFKTNSQLRVHSYGIDIGNSINAISVGYQKFESLGMGTNFINKGQPELSYFHPYIGCSVILKNDPFLFFGRLSYDDRSGIIQDEFVTQSFIMKPVMSYVTFESALMIEPWKHIYAYGGPSLSFLIQNSIGSIGDRYVENGLSGMNSPIPGFFAGISYDLAINQSIIDVPVSITPFIEASLLFNQRTGEFPENQDGFDNIWSTASFKCGIRLSLSPKEHINESPKKEFTLSIPHDFSGKRAMTESVPILTSMTVSETQQIIDILKQSSQSRHYTTSMLCSGLDPIQMHTAHSEQRICIQKRVFHYLSQHIKKNDDTLILRMCSNDNVRLGKELMDILHNILQIPASRIVTQPCEPHAQHTEEVSWQLSSKDTVYASIELKSVSPSENIIECNVQDIQQFQSWNMTINGPQEFSYALGPFTQSTIFFDGSELLQGEAGTGLYTCTLMLQDSNQLSRTIEKQFSVRMTPESKMQGHSYIFPHHWSDAAIISALKNDLSHTFQDGDEIIIIANSPQRFSNQKRIRIISEFIDEYAAKNHKSSKKMPKIVYKGENLTLYDQRWSWGREYEQAIRVEIIH